MQLQSDKTAAREANSGQFSCKDAPSTSMMAPSTHSQHSSPFYSSSIISMNDNYNCNCYSNPTTILRSAPTLTRHHPLRHQSKTATHRRRIRSSSTIIAGSGRRLVSPHHQQRALTKHEHHRSFKYTRTLDIIPEDQQDSPEEPRLRRQPRAPFCVEHNTNNDETEETNNWMCTTTDADQNLQACNHDDTNNSTFLATDFWHSMRSMKKSVTSVSLESLAVNANDGENENGNDENQSPNMATAALHIYNNNNNNISIPPNLVLEENDEFEKFLDDWEL